LLTGIARPLTAGYQEIGDLLLRLKDPHSLDFDTGDFI
jgi:hypothetical protein